MANPRQQWEREEDSLPLWAKLIFKYGILSVMAGWLVYVIVTRLVVDMSAIKVELHDHVNSTGFYMHQICVNIAESNGKSPASCDYEHYFK